MVYGDSCVGETSSTCLGYTLAGINASDDWLAQDAYLSAFYDDEKPAVGQYYYGNLQDKSGQTGYQYA